MYPDTYPGAAPSHHYLLLDDYVHEITLPGGDITAACLSDGRDLDAMLRVAGLAPIAERIPVLAYGANRNPHTLELKFAHHDYETDGNATMVPVLAGTVSDVDVVAAGLSAQGCLYADLTPSPDTTVQVHVALFDVDQARAIHESEGVGRGGYDCARIPGFALDRTELTLEPLSYAGSRGVFVSPTTGEPLAFSAIDARARRFTALDQIAAMSHVIDVGELTDELQRLLDLDTTTDPAEVAREVVCVLSGAWWYAHHTGDHRPRIAGTVERLIRRAISPHEAATPAAEYFARQGRAVETAAVFAAGPGLRLAAQLD